MRCTNRASDTGNEQAAGMPTLGKLPFYTASVLLLLVFGVLRFLFCTLVFRPLVVRLFIRFAGSDISAEVYGEGLFGWEMYKAVTAALLMDLQKKARVGADAPNPSLVSVDGRSRLHLLDVAEASRPLVVNFGSCTCPVFMAKLHEFNSIMRDFGDIADFLVIYISEAHPTDGWAFKTEFDVRQHRCIEERCEAAKLLLATTNMTAPVLVDTAENEANALYGALPIRLYVILNGKVELSGGFGPTFYKVEDVKKWLSRWKENEKLCV